MFYVSMNVEGCQFHKVCNVHEQLHFLVYLCDSGIIWLHYNADCKLSTYAFFDLKMYRRGNCVYGTALILWATCCSTWYIFDFASRVFEQTASWTLLYRCYIINVRRRKKEVLRYIASIIREHVACFRFTGALLNRIPGKKNNVRVTNLIELGSVFHKIKSLTFKIH